MTRRITSIPGLGADFDQTKPTLNALIEAIETGQRMRPEVLKSFVKVEDLVDLRIIQLAKNGKALLNYQPTWVIPTYENSWVSFGSTFAGAGYYRDPFNRVFLRGVVKNGSAIPTAVFTLPAGYRPDKESLFVTISNAAIGRIDVLTSGAVRVEAGSTTYVSLDGISFLAAQ